MKMKKIVCAMVSAALLVSMAAATAFAVESVPSKTGTDADAGKTEVSTSGSVGSDILKPVFICPMKAQQMQRLQLRHIKGINGNSRKTVSPIVGCSNGPFLGLLKVAGQVKTGTEIQ